jgi:hypothetical protein
VIRSFARALSEICHGEILQAQSKQPRPRWRTITRASMAGRGRSSARLPKSGRCWGRTIQTRSTP